MTRVHVYGTNGCPAMAVRSGGGSPAMGGLADQNRTRIWERANDLPATLNS